MKLAIAIFAIIGITCAVPVQRSGLKQDLDDFLDLIPKEKFIALINKYRNDPEVQKVVAYLKSDDFAAVVRIISEVDEVQELIRYLEGQGIPVVDYINELADQLGLPHWPENSLKFSTGTSRSIRDFVDEAIALIPVDAMIGLALDKLTNSPPFQELYLKIASLDYQKLHDQALSHPEIVDLLNRLNNVGINTKKIWNTLKSLFGWQYKTYGVTKSLQDDINDFLALLPKEKFIDLYNKYKDDPEVKQALKKIVAYLKSKEFAKLVDIVKSTPEVRDLVSYIEDQGVPIVELLNRIADRLGLAPWYNTFYYIREDYASESIRQIVKEIIALIPLDDILALTVDKLVNSESFQELYLKISSMDYQKLHDNALSHPEVVDIIKRLNDYGIDTKKIWNFLKSIFGWSYKSYNTFAATKSLQDDINDFLALLPKEKFIDLYNKYKDDPEVKQALKKIVAYLKGEEFAQLVEIVKSSQEVRDLVSYIEDQGVPITQLLNKIADRLGLPHWPSSSDYIRVSYASETIRQLVREIIDLIPLDDIVALTVDKLVNSESFQELYLKISSLNYQKLHDEALSHPEVVDIIKRLNDYGIDTKKIEAFLKSLFGWE